MSKTLGNTDASGASVNVPDIVFWGDGDKWELICKASSEKEGWMKSTKAMEIEGIGVVLQTSTQQQNAELVGQEDDEFVSCMNSSYSLCDTTVFIPNVKIERTMEDGKVIGRSLVAIRL